MTCSWIRRFLLISCVVVFAVLTCSAQSGDVVVFTDTTWPAGTYQLDSLTVTNGASLTLGGLNQTVQVDGKWVGSGVTIQAASVQVDAGSKISADGQGYTGGATGAAGNGPGGGGGSFFYDAAGGSYGGRGYSSPTLSAGPIYGLALTPTDLGSGGGGTTVAAGGSNYGPHVGGDGGGAIRLIVSGTLTLNGTISANGRAGAPNWPPSLDNYAGGGAGGSIWVTAYSLSGSGFFQAVGGPRYWSEQPTVPSGGGGRIAIYYEDASSFTGFNSSIANGAPGAEQGTVGFFNTTSNDVLVTGAQKFTYPEDSVISANNVTVRGGATLFIGGGSSLTAESDILVTENSKLVLQGKNTSAQLGGAWAGVGVTVTTPYVQVDAGSSMNADGTGYTGTPPPQTGNGPGGGGGTPVYNSAGGSYGGLGAGGGLYTVGPTYGSETQPTDLGSGGGGADNSIGGNGGGATRLIISDSVLNNGTISANGSDGGTYAGGGSGGSIWANIGSMSGTGIISANGATRAGGGRIAIYHTGDIPDGFAQANGGVGGGQPGTIHVKQMLSVYIASSPLGMSFSVDGTTYTGGHFFSWEEASEHTVATTSPQAGVGMQSVFNHWTDGGAISHTVIASADTTSIAAVFDTQYQLTTAVFPQGSGTVTPPSGSFYDYYSTVNVAATPSEGYVFDHWSGPVANINDAATTVLMSEARSITAVFSTGDIPVTIRTIPAGLSFTVDGSAYTSEQTFNWSVGANHTIATTSPQAGAIGTRYIFADWSDAGAISHTITVSTSPATYTAQFTTQHLLTVSMVPADSGTVVASPASSDGFYNSWETVQLTAAPNANYTFANWSGDLSGTLNPQTIAMNAAHSVTANFALGTPSITVTSSPAGRSFSVDGTNYTTAQTFKWTVGSNHTIATTTPQAGAAGTRYVFTNWSDGGAISHTITVAANPTTYTANFTAQYQLTTTVVPVGSGTVVPSPTSSDGYYDGGQSVQLTANASAGYAWANWSGDLIGTTNPQIISMIAPRSVTANFAPSTVSITITTNPAGRSFTVDGTSYTAAQAFSWEPGSPHTIATTSPQGSDGTRYVFAAWSDGGASSHGITTPANSTIYTATFTTQYLLTTQASPVAGGVVSPATGYYDMGTVVNVSATANSGYAFANWSGDLTGSTNPTTIAMSAPRSLTANFATNTVQVTVGTAPTGLSFTVDGTPYTSSQTLTWTLGSSHTLATTSPQPSGSGTRYVYGSWSDGGALSHTVTASASTTSYTASFTTQYLLTTQASPVAGGVVSPATGYYDMGTVVNVSATANSGYAFANWSGDLTGTTNPQGLTMNAPHAVTANFNSIPVDFQLIGDGLSDVARAGRTASYRMGVKGVNGFSGRITPSCFGLPALSSCSFKPTQPNVTGNSTVPFTMNIQTTAPTRGKHPSSGTPPGTYLIQMTGTSGSITHTISVTLVVQ